MRFLWGRLTRIYPTYWFYFFLTVAIFLIKPNWVNSSQGHQTQLVSSFLLLPSNQLPLVMVAWSLIHELWFYLVFSFLLTLRERLLLPSLLLWGAIVTIGNLLFWTSDLSAGVRIALHPYSLEFIMGALVAIFISTEHAAKLTARNAALIIAIVLSVALPAVHAFDVLEQGPMLRATIMGTLYGSLVLSVAILERLNKFNPPKSLQFVGDVSYTIYLSHILVLSAIGRLWQMASPAPDSLLDNMLVFLIIPAAVVGYGWVGYRLIEEPILRVSHRLRVRWFDNGFRDMPNPTVNSRAAR